MKKLSEKILHKGQWLSLYAAAFENKAGEHVHWEFIRRSRDARPMAIVAQMLPSKRFILIKQYRPAIEGYILGFPAGLWTDDIGQAVIELKQETGYTGTIVSVSPEMKSNTGIMDEAGCVVYMHVDENDPVNRNPRQELEPEEDIEVLLVSRDGIGQAMAEARSQGVAVSPSLWFLFVLPGQFA